MCQALLHCMMHAASSHQFAMLHALLRSSLQVRSVPSMWRRQIPEFTKLIGILKALSRSMVYIHKMARCGLAYGCRWMNHAVDPQMSSKLC